MNEFCYVAKASCGHYVGAVTAEGKDLDIFTITLNEWRAQGLQIEQKSVEFIRGGGLTFCECRKDIAPASAQALGLAEMSQIIGVRASTIGNWMRQGKIVGGVAFPAPQRLKMGPVWIRQDLEPWLQKFNQEKQHDSKAEDRQRPSEASKEPQDKDL